MIFTIRNAAHVCTTFSGLVFQPDRVDSTGKGRCYLYNGCLSVVVRSDDVFVNTGTYLHEAAWRLATEIAAAAGQDKTAIEGRQAYRKLLHEELFGIGG